MAFLLQSIKPDSLPAQSEQFENGGFQMRKLLLSSIAVAALLSTSAFAADLRVKALPPATLGYPATQGMYWGIYTEAGGGVASGVSDATVTANTGKIFDAQASFGGLVGYAWTLGPNVSYWLEGSVGWQNLNSQSQGISFTGPVQSEIVACAATPISNMLALIGANNIFGQFPGLPALPAGLTASPAMFGLCGGARANDVSANFGVGQFKAWEFAPEIGVETRVLLSNSTAFFVRTMYVAPSDAFCNVSGVGIKSCAGLGQALTVRTGIAF